jgi:uncharacterized protein YukE
MMAELQAAVGIMRTEANTWDAQSDEMATARGKVDAMELGYLEAGVFMPLVHSYNDLVHDLRSRCDEGVTALRAVGQTLRDVANTYEKTDEQNARKLKNIY